MACAAAFAALGWIWPARPRTRSIGTRDSIYPADEREVTVSVVTGNQRLLQVWVTVAIARTRPTQRRRPSSSRRRCRASIRQGGRPCGSMFTGTAPAQDRESVYWLNVLEIPPKPKVGRCGWRQFSSVRSAHAHQDLLPPQGSAGRSAGCNQAAHMAIGPAGRGLCIGVRESFCLQRVLQLGEAQEHDCSTRKGVPGRSCVRQKDARRSP